MLGAKSAHALTSHSMASHARSVASTTVPAMSVLAMIVPVMTVPVVIVQPATVHVPMKPAAKPLVIAMAKANAISRHARALSPGAKPALKAAAMIASHPSPPLARRALAASPSASAALAHGVGPMSVGVGTAPSCPVAVARK